MRGNSLVLILQTAFIPFSLPLALLHVFRGEASSRTVISYDGGRGRGRAERERERKDETYGRSLKSKGGEEKRLSERRKRAGACDRAGQDGSALQFPGEGALHGSGDVLELRQCGLLERDGVGHWDVSASHSLNRSVQIVEGLALHDRSGNLSADTTLRIALLKSHQAICLLDGLDDRLAIQRTDGSEGRNERKQVRERGEGIRGRGGISHLRLITSTEIPSFSRFLATSRAAPTGLEKVTMVTSVPSLSTFALPMGIKKSGD
jgi:hypothetical protein